MEREEESRKTAIPFLFSVMPKNVSRHILSHLYLMLCHSEICIDSHCSPYK